jgi:hypothetical protein
MRKRSSNKSKSVIYPGFLHLHKPLLLCPDFQSLNAHSLKLLICIGSQYNGYNNGDLAATRKVLKKLGWFSTSNQLLTKCLKELQDKNLIILTKQGGLHMGPNLFALMWQPIDECSGKLDVEPTSTPPRSFSC